MSMISPRKRCLAINPTNRGEIDLGQPTSGPSQGSYKAGGKAKETKEEHRIIESNIAPDGSEKIKC